MSKKILVAGGTGNLGERIIKNLIANGAEVIALVRSNSDPNKIEKLEKLGANIFKINNWSLAELTAACKDVSCVVSALAGLSDVIIDNQKILLDAAVAAGVPRFIPSDYSLDFTKFNHGENRNLDFRRMFHSYLDQQPIKATTLFNGAFMDLLTDQMPMILFKQKRILYWGNADHQMTFTTIDDTARFTALAALDATTPRLLHIAGDHKSPREIMEIMTALTGNKFHLLRTGGKRTLGVIIKIAQTMAPSKNKLYPAWQGMQYIHNMIDERAIPFKSDKNRYPDMTWTSVKELLAKHLMS